VLRLILIWVALQPFTKFANAQLVEPPFHALSSMYDSISPWQSWRLVENFSFGKDRGNIAMIAELESLHPFFRDKIYQLIKNCSNKGITLEVVEAYRTHAKQMEYFSMGKKFTNSLGGKSKHQYGLAVDLVPIVKGKPVWDNKTLWLKIGIEGEKLGLRWGGRWKKPYDPCHFEWSGGLKTTQLASGLLPTIPTGNSSYPCIDEDLETLRLHWSAWEMSQPVPQSP
jgi:hypothetical protein